MNGRGVRATDVASPVPAVAENGKAADVDIDTFRHVDIDVPEGRHHRHCCLLLLDSGIAQVEVEIAEGTGGDGSSAQPEPSTPVDVAKQGRSEAGRLASRVGLLHEYLGQIFLHPCQITGDLRSQGGVDAFREFFERQAAREKMLLKRDDSLVAFSV